jgi:hypothetical protein
MRSSESAPVKSEPALIERLPLQPIRRVEAPAGGSSIFTFTEVASAPSIKTESFAASYVSAAWCHLLSQAGMATAPLPAGGA